ncbi:MAG: peptidyl-prolyl cis-trans isomerase [Planctomycetes bacterium]|nr:peptidyl-prolyl cis-trans isomerase [Planctomycetota bacterium]
MQVKLTTNHGDIVLELDPKNAPISTENFVGYVKAGHYDGTVFHRVIDSFMIQGGGHTADLRKKATNKPIKNEWKNGLKNTRGTVAMARLGGDADSATSQFFINTVDNAFLDRPQPDGAAYAVFGKVISGMEVVDKIRKVKTTTKQGMGDVPVEPVVIAKAELLL